MDQYLFWAISTYTTQYGVPQWLLVIASFVQWLADSSFCFLNICDQTHVAPSGSCSLSDLLMCSTDFLACVSLQVEDDPYESDHFAVSISLNFNSPLLPTATHYRWPLICQDINNTLQSCSDMAFSSIRVQHEKANNSSIQKSTSKGLLVGQTARCSNLLNQTNKKIIT